VIWATNWARVGISPTRCNLHNPIGGYSDLQRVAQLQVSVFRDGLRNPHSQAVSPFQHLSLHIPPVDTLYHHSRGRKPRALRRHRSRACNRHHSNVVFLSELLRSFSNRNGGLSGNSFRPIESEQLAFQVLRFNHSIGIEGQPAARLNAELVVS
jgi:hypothetical protein